MRKEVILLSSLALCALISPSSSYPIGQGPNPSATVQVETLLPDGFPIRIGSAALRDLNGVRSFTCLITNASDEQVKHLKVSLMIYKPETQFKRPRDLWTGYRKYFDLCKDDSIPSHSTHEFIQSLGRVMPAEGRALVVVESVEGDDSFWTADEREFEKAELLYLRGEKYSLPKAQWWVAKKKPRVD